MMAIDPSSQADNDEDHRLSSDWCVSLVGCVPLFRGSFWLSFAAVEPRGLQSWYARKEPWVADRTPVEMCGKRTPKQPRRPNTAFPCLPEDARGIILRAGQSCASSRVSLLAEKRNAITIRQWFDCIFGVSACNSALYLNGDPFSGGHEFFGTTSPVRASGYY
jgi:hypothetical protein